MATVTRLLPWRRQHSSPDDELAPVLQSFRRRHPKASTALMTKAFETARTAHSQQTRKSGEGYINHPLAVAKIVADIHRGIAANVTVLTQHDRAAAIREALKAARDGDVVLIAGKGHEDYQIIGAERRPFDDAQQVRVALGLAPSAMEQG
mgnify:CR=1 FL=1